MINQLDAALEILQQKSKDSHGLARQRVQDLNTVAGTEQDTRRKARAVALITGAAGRQAGQKFAIIHPGPSFANDMVKEFTELIDCHCTPLASSAKQLPPDPRPLSGR